MTDHVHCQSTITRFKQLAICRKAEVADSVNADNIYLIQVLAKAVRVKITTLATDIKTISL